MVAILAATTYMPVGILVCAQLEASRVCFLFRIGRQLSEDSSTEFRSEISQNTKHMSRGTLKRTSAQMLHWSYESSVSVNPMHQNICILTVGPRMSTPTPVAMTNSAADILTVRSTMMRKLLIDAAGACTSIMWLVIGRRKVV